MKGIFNKRVLVTLVVVYVALVVAEYLGFGPASSAARLRGAQ